MSAVDGNPHLIDHIFNWDVHFDDVIFWFLHNGMGHILSIAMVGQKDNSGSLTPAVESNFLSGFVSIDNWHINIE